MTNKKKLNFEHFSIALQGFAQEHDLELDVFNDCLHWRLSDGAVTLDVWPTTGKYWIKDIPFGRGFGDDERQGKLPFDWNELDTWLGALFGV